MEARIEDRKLWSVSPSQVDSFRKCQRVWYNASVLKDRAPAPPFMARGTAMHFGIETYLKTGEVIIETEVQDAPGVKWPVMEFVQAAIPFLPKPIIDPYWDVWKANNDGGLMIEQAGEMATWPGENGKDVGPSFVQYIDLVEAYPDRATITDHKSTSDLRYAKTPQELSENVQLISNAKWLFSISDYKEIELRHLYLCTKGKRPKAMPVSVVVTREHVEAEWQKILATIREMSQWAKLAPKTADPLPPNTDHCNAYGGCQYRAKCGLEVKSVFQIRGKGVPEMGVNLLDEMLAKSKNLETAAPVAAPATVGLAVGGVAPPVAAGGLAALLGKPVNLAPTTVAPLMGIVVPVQNPTVQTITTSTSKLEIPVTIVPPDAPSPISTPEDVAAANPPAEEKKGKPGRKKKAAPYLEQTAADIASPVTTTAVIGHTVISVSEETVKELAEALKPVTGVATAELKIEQPASDAADEVTKARTLLETPDAAFGCGVDVLFIDCLPGKGYPGEQPRDLTEFMHAFNNLAAASAGAVDYRLIRYESKGYLAAAIRLFMRGLPKAVYVDSRMCGADVFLETVTPYAKMVIKGVR